MKKLALCLRWAAAAATLVIAALLCWQCIDIYLTGNSAANLDDAGVHISPVYSAADVGARLKSLAAPLGACVLVIASALAVQAAQPAVKEKTALTAENRLRLMKKRIGEMPEAAAKEEKLRRRTWVWTGAALLVCAALCLTYLLDGENFASWDLEKVMGGMLLHVAPWVVLGLAVAYAASVICARSMARECEALKGRPAAPAAQKPEGRQGHVGIVRAVLLAAAIVFIVLGVMNGGMYDVLVKAINICTECIGLG